MPGPVYCDTSALLKLYLPERGSDEFNEAVKGRDDVLVSDLAVTEIISAIARRLRQGSRKKLMHWWCSPLAPIATSAR